MMQRSDERYLLPKNRCVNVAMKLILISRPMTPSTAAMADSVSVC